MARVREDLNEKEKIEEDKAKEKGRKLDHKKNEEKIKEKGTEKIRERK